ncbi:anti-sigma factor [Streptomyces sp. 549]|uniref:anti-sigma factor n=1 Tax=Streptomyces sp. 549 TaxID=3049076 RepID=UPI0024C2EB35|nr:anti-sigma factor [Streptomyces sp. 549]MDK1472103.1 anti-sigma factor [Streptomyces sp. 549]
MNTADLHTLTGAYAVHALSTSEREEFERHLAACTSCTQEVGELTETAERLGRAVAVAPPPELRQRVLRQVTTVRQEPPRPSGGASAVGPGRRVRAVPRFLLAACLAVAAAFGGVAAWQYQSAQDARQQARQAEQRTEELAGVLAAPDARMRSDRLSDGATVTVVVSAERDRAAFLASGMPEPPSGKVYQLWFDDGGTMRPAGLMPSAASGEAVLLEGKVGDASGMGVTVEPAGGSPQPTSQPLAVMEFPAA